MMKEKDSQKPLKIDFVVTWVDGGDKKWQKEKAKYVKGEGGDEALEKHWTNSEIRFRDWGLLKYWFRGVAKFTPWVNKIYFVTCGQKPEWLDENNPKLVLVEHKDFIEKKYLPTFSSNVIELNLHRIKELSEHFVLFNDDMFILKEMKPTDFFMKGLPCETAGIECMRPFYRSTHPEFFDTQIISGHFKKKVVIKKYWKKWFSPKNGKKALMKTLLLMPWRDFTGFFISHLPTSCLKSTFNTVWAKEESTLRRTCENKTRGVSDLSHWLMKDWQLVTGKFYPRSSAIGRWYEQEKDYAKIADSIMRQKYKMVCVNDSECSEKEFMRRKQIMIDAFEKILPEKSEFEK